MLRRGYDLSRLRARQVCEADYQKFDLLLAMDWDNLALLQADCPPVYAHKLKLFMSCAEPFKQLGEVVPDPYSGGADDFEGVLDLLEATSDGLVRKLRHRWENYRLSDK